VYRSCLETQYLESARHRMCGVDTPPFMTDRKRRSLPSVFAIIFV
jgi:hypothetical protein